MQRPGKGLGLIHNLTLVHLLLAAAGAGSVYLALREVRRRYVSQWRLFAPPALALVAALGLILIQLGQGVPGWLFGTALSVGAVLGFARGFTIRIQHDMYRPILNIPHQAKLLLLGVSMAVAAAVGCEIVGAFMGDSFDQLRKWSAVAASACAAAMLLRAVALKIRLHTFT